jgi:integrase
MTSKPRGSRRRGRIAPAGDGIWRIRLSLGRDSSGRQQYLHKTVYGKKGDAEKALTQLLVRKDEHRIMSQGRETLDAWIAEWLSTRRGSTSIRTFSDYGRILHQHLPAELRCKRLVALSPTDVQRWVAGLSAKRLSPQTVRSIHGALRTCLNKARRLGKIRMNVCELVDLPKKEHHEMQTFTAEQAERFLNGAEAIDSPYYPFFVVMLHTGMRPGELAGLKWSDWDGTTLTVQRALKYEQVGQPRVLGPTKTGRPKVIPLGERARAALQLQKRQQEDHQSLLGPMYHDAGFVFANEIGKPIEFSNVRERHFKPLLIALGLPKIRLYDLRHSCASLLLAAGEPVKVVSERLGHCNAFVTLSVYAHVLPGQQKQASDRLDSLLRAART